MEDTLALKESLYAQEKKTAWVEGILDRKNRSRRKNTPVRAHNVYFELSNICNFTCDFCPITDSKRKKQYMDFALYQKGIDDIVRDGVADTVQYHILGEPFLYPKIFEAFEYARARGLKVQVTTNGSLLTEDRVRKIINAKLDKLTISVETIDEQEHACRGSNILFADYYRLIIDAVKLFHASDTTMTVELCLINTQTKKYFDIDRELRMNFGKDAFKKKLIPFMADLYAAIGKPVSAKKLETSLRKVNLNSPKLIRIDKRITIYNQLLADWGNAFTGKKIYPAKTGYCGYALMNVGILNTGEVTMCCVDYDGKTSLGTIREKSLGEILSSAKTQAIRDGFAKNKLVHPYCQRCFGGTSRVKAWAKGLVSIYLFRVLKFEPARAKEVCLFPA